MISKLFSRRMVATKLFKEFFDSEKAGGLILIICTVLSMLIANSGFGDSYTFFWNTYMFGHSITHWVNDGLMAIFFLLIGLELKRELYVGELSNIKNALFPIIAAIGGVLLPAGIFYFINSGTEYSAGTGIPMATDIAFAIGILALLGKRVPVALKVFLVALAVIDDLVAILTIAIFYSKGLSLMNLGIALGILAVLFALNRMKINYLIVYLIGFVAMWFFMLNSGIHATITGVLVAFVIPFSKKDNHSASDKLQHYLHAPVSFIILPIFALANTAIIIQSNWADGLTSTLGIGVIIGLVLGKPIGITLFSYLAVKFGFTKKPNEVNWMNIAGVGFIAGIGFTMSIFISILAFDSELMIESAKIAVLAASLFAAILGMIWLKLSFMKN